MPSNLGIKGAPCLVLGNFIRNLGLQKGEKGPTGRPRKRLKVGHSTRQILKPRRCRLEGQGT